MKIAAVLCVATLTILILNSLDAKGDTNVVTVIWLLPMNNNGRSCLTVAHGKVNSINDKLFVSSEFQAFEVWREEMICENWSTTGFFTNNLIILPMNAGLMCFKGGSCSASVILKNPQYQLNGTDCYDMLSGDYWTDKQSESTMRTIGLAFHVDEVIVNGIECRLGFVDNLLRSDWYNRLSYKHEPSSGAIEDIWSPVEEIAQEAVSQVTAVGQKFVKQITDEINSIQDSINQQTKYLSGEMTAGTKKIIQALFEKTQQIEIKLASVEAGLENGMANGERFLHLFLHILELVGGLVVLVVLYKLYKKAKVLFVFFKWLGLHLFGRRRHNNRK